MNLSDFINETIKEIVKGVEKTQKELSEYGVIVNPQEAGGEKEEVKNLPYSIHYVDFEVVVAIEEQQDTRKKAGINIRVITAGIGEGKEEKESKTTKVSFSIPIIYPYISNENKPKRKNSPKMTVLKDKVNPPRL